MLGWFIDFMKEQHAGFKIKKQHHFKCSEALNRQFNMGVTATQVERHFRHYKENWKFVATALAKSGNTFDTTRFMVIISESEKAKLKVFSIFFTLFLLTFFCFSVIYTTKRHATFCGIGQEGSLLSLSNSSMKCKNYSSTAVMMVLLL
jgi:hypothetical protein